MRTTSLFARSIRLLPLIASAVFADSFTPAFPSKIYGVNLGSWLVLEPWMLPQEWLDMGGQSCSECDACIASEGAFAQAYPNTVNATFATHWETWFNQTDVDALVAVGINTVRIPLGYWIIEALVNQTNGEYFPQGGLVQLRRGLQQLYAAGIVAILDHHGLPGAQEADQMFTGRCTKTPQFYTPYNYQRALIWTAVMATLVHVDHAFAAAVAIEAANEPIMNAAQTPGYGQFQLDFVRTVRAVELLLRLPVPDAVRQQLRNTTIDAPNDGNYTNMLPGIDDTTAIFTPTVRAALVAAVPILDDMGFLMPAPPGASKAPIVTSFMDMNWQYGSNVPNPANAALGPQLYDNHLYFNFGGVAAANPTAYLQSICNLPRVQNDAAKRNSPLIFGEWGLPTQFSATDAFLVQWADAQKLAYSQGAGWIFWNFKVEKSALAGNLSRQWSYLDGVRLGYLTKDPSQLHDPDVCVPYLSASSSASASSSKTSAASSSLSSGSLASTGTTVASASTATTTPATSPDLGTLDAYRHRRRREWARWL